MIEQVADNISLFGDVECSSLDVTVCPPLNGSISCGVDWGFKEKMTAVIGDSLSRITAGIRYCSQRIATAVKGLIFSNGFCGGEPYFSPPRVISTPQVNITTTNKGTVSTEFHCSDCYGVDFTVYTPLIGSVTCVTRSPEKIWG